MSSKKAKYYAEDTGAPVRRRKRRRRGREKGIPSWVYRVILVLLAAVAGLVLWVNRANLTPENILDWVQEQVVGMGVGDGYPAAITGSVVSPKNFASSSGEAVMVSDTHLTVLNGTGKEVASRQHSFSFPVLRLSGQEMLLYNLGGSGYQVESRSRTLQKGSAEGNILGGAISSGGHYALLTESDGYLGQLTVYNDQNERQFEYKFSSCYPSAAALNSDATQALVGGLFARDGGLVSCLYLLDLNSSESVEPAAEYEENMLLDAFWYEDGTAAAVGDRLAALVDASGRVTEYQYDGRQLAAYAGAGGITALALLPYTDAASGELVLLDAGGRKAAFSLPEAPDSVALFGNTAAVLAGGTVYAYSIAEGVLLAQAEAGEDAAAIALRDETSAYVLGVSEIRLLEWDG